MVPAPPRRSLSAQVRRALTLSLALVLLVAALSVAATAGKSALRTIYFASSKAGDALGRETHFGRTKAGRLFRLREESHAQH